jgi:hypothetical protein
LSTVSLVSNDRSPSSAASSAAAPARRRLGGRRLVVAVDLFQQRVFLQQAVDLGVELERRELQQPDRLLQLRRQREVLGELELEGLFHRLA